MPSICPRHWQLPRGDRETGEGGNKAPVDINGSFWRLFNVYDWTNNNDWKNGWIYPPGDSNTSAYVAASAPPFYNTYIATMWMSGSISPGTSVRYWSKTVPDTDNDPIVLFINETGPNLTNILSRRNAIPLRCLTQ